MDDSEFVSRKGHNIFLFSKLSALALRFRLLLVKQVLCPFSRVKRQGQGAEQLPTCGAEVKEEYSFYSAITGSSQIARLLDSLPIIRRDQLHHPYKTHKHFDLFILRYSSTVQLFLCLVTTPWPRLSMWQYKGRDTLYGTARHDTTKYSCTASTCSNSH
jgi:hypothetical protein